MANSYLTRSAQTATSNTTMTISVWFKRSKLGSGTIWMHENQASHNAKLLLFFSGTNDQISMQSYNGSAEYTLTPTRKFRDLNAWYNVQAVWNTTVATTADRMQIWVNGVRETSFSTANYPSRNHEIDLSNKAHQIGRYGSSGGYSNYWNGLMSQFILVDGQAYNASKFGSVDSVTGEWTVNASPTGITYGNRGVWLKMENSSNLGLDSSGKNNNYTNSGVVRTPDCPSNVFATVNPLWFNSSTFSNGNNTVAGGSAHRPNIPTLAASSGKYYFEAKIISGNSTRWWMGYADQEYLDSKQNLTSNIDLGGGNISGGTNQKNGAVTAGWGNALQQSPVSTIQNFFSSAGGANDIMAMAIDLDNQKIWWSQNGTWRNGSASASTTFNASYPDSTNLDAGRSYYLCTGSENSKWSINYGNGFFGTTAITTNSGNGYAGAEGASKFNYPVPSGFSALSTKGLNQ